MSSQENCIVIRNKEILDFFNNNQHINVENIMLIMISILKEIGTDITKIINNTSIGEILNIVKDMNQQINHQFQTINNSISLKLVENNNLFIDNLKAHISNASHDNSDKVMSSLNKITDTFIDKINLTIPRTQEETHRKIQDTLVSFQKNVLDDIRTFIYSNHGERDLKEFITTLEHKISISQQPIISLISSNHEMIASSVNNMQSRNEKTICELSDFLSKYKNNSQFKGFVSEVMLEEVLNQTYPTAEIVNTTNITGAGDILMRREGKQDIIWENKCYNNNVPSDEIKKFIKDVTENKCHGILISQKSGIALKPNWFIEVHHDKALLYIHKADYCPEKIKLAVDIIDSLSEKLQIISSVENINGVSIKKELLDQINEQYKSFILKKENLIQTLKETNKKLLACAEELTLPELKLFLDERYASAQNQLFICEICNMSYPNKRSLAAHKKSHPNFKKISSQNQNNIIDVSL